MLRQWYQEYIKNSCQTLVAHAYIIKVTVTSLAWWYIPVISALWRQRQEDGEYEAKLGYIARPCLKIQKQKQK
jgi:hypothetical protein